MVTALRAQPWTTWLRAVPVAVLVYALIAVPADLVDTPLFGRPVPVRPIDHVIASVAASLIGLTLAVQPTTSDEDLPDRERSESGRVRDERHSAWGGFVSFLALGCPVCNQAVVALVGTGGALAWWAPVQPFVGLAGVGLVAAALRRRLSAVDVAASPVSAGRRLRWRPQPHGRRRSTTSP